MPWLFYQLPVLTIRLKKLVMIGVTGTKGKTTTTHMIRAILLAAGKKVGMIGTTGTVIGYVVTPTLNTTPESYELHQAFAQMVEAGCEYAVMEVSSQGIKMHRTDGLYFELCHLYQYFPRIILDRENMLILRNICTIRPDC